MRSAWWLACVVAICGCGPDEMGRNTGSSGRGGNHDLGDDLAMSLSLDLASGRPDACAAVSAMATLHKRPVDVIFVIDNSGSMSDEINAVQNNININFAQIIGASGLDYRVIMLSWYATADGGGDYRVCIRPPLGGNVKCDATEPKPIDTSNFYQYNDQILSWNSLAEVIHTYNVRDPSCDPAPAVCSAANGWSDWLRADSLKVFIEITDDESKDLTSDDFESMLFALTPSRFGDASDRNYVFYSIVGLKENTPPTMPYAPTDPVITQVCSTAVAAGTQYQNLSILTGGLRYPICQLSSFDSVFQSVANGVITGSKVACNFDVPDGPGGQLINLSTVVVRYTPSNGSAIQAFMQVSDASKCSGQPGSFYITSDADADSDQIVLCPDTCSTVQADDQAQIGVLFDCSVS